MEAVRKLLDQFEAEAAIDDLVKLRADGGPSRLEEALEIAREWDLDEGEVRGRFEEAELALRELRPEKILAEVQPIRVEPKVEVVRPKARAVVEWRQTPSGGWEYRLEGENMFRRHFGPPPKLALKAIEAVPQLKVVEAQKPKPEPEPKPEEEEKKAEVQESGSESKAIATAAKVAPLGFQHSKSPAGIPASFENAIRALDRLGAECRYDVFHDRIIVKGHECGVRGDA
jgi:hypothetical protein